MRALHESEARLNAFSVSSPAGLAMLDLDLRYRKIAGTPLDSGDHARNTLGSIADERMVARRTPGQALEAHSRLITDLPMILVARATPRLVQADSLERIAVRLEHRRLAAGGQMYGGIFETEEVGLRG